MEVEIYSKTNCVFCDKAKMRLQKHNPKKEFIPLPTNTGCACTKSAAPG